MLKIILITVLSISTLFASESSDTTLTAEEQAMFVALEVNSSMWELNEYESILILKAMDHQNRNNSENRIELLKAILTYQDVITDANRIVGQYGNDFDATNMKKAIQKADSLIKRIKQTNFPSVDW